MELTGELYGFFSNKEIAAVLEEMKKYAESINYKFEIDSFEGEENLFFYKDENMMHYHEENGYNTDLNGEGCFNLEAKKVKLNGIAKLFEFDGKSDFRPYDINLAFSQVYYYLLTIPHFKQEDEFSRKIHDTILGILTKD
jgi:hypothetical protein